VTDAGAIEVRDLRPGELAAAVVVLGRGMRDNPIHVVAYGDDPERRLRCHTRLMGALFRLVPAQQPLCAVLTDGTLVGVTGATPPGACQPTVAQRVRLLPTMAALGPRTASRVGKWMAAWTDHDPEEAHVHLGPVAVDSHLQGRGIGSLMMRAHCDRLGANGQIGYNRPFAGAGQYRTPLPGLYLCGGSTHPGGNITGLCGYNAAAVIAADLTLPSWWNPAVG